LGDWGIWLLLLDRDRNASILLATKKMK